MVQSMDLNKMGLVEISEKESLITDGGNWWKVVERAVTALGIADAVERFVDGWNSVKCNSK